MIEKVFPVFDVFHTFSPIQFSLPYILFLVVIFIILITGGHIFMLIFFCIFLQMDYERHLFKTSTLLSAVSCHQIRTK